MKITSAFFSLCIIATIPAFALPPHFAHEPIYNSESFCIYAEDSLDYSRLIADLERANSEFTMLFGRRAQPEINIYVYHDQTSFNLWVFGQEDPFIDTVGAGYWLVNEMHLVSPFTMNRSTAMVPTIPVHELLHFYWPFPVEYTWLGEGVAWYWSGQLSPVDSLSMPQSFSDLIFWWESKRQTIHAYNCSGWMVKYIFEELVDRDVSIFTEFFQHPHNYELLGLENEVDFFAGWQQYVTDMQPMFELEL